MNTPLPFFASRSHASPAWRAIALCAAMWLGAPVAQAEEAPAPVATPEWRHENRQPSAPVGTQTRQWLQAQGQREQASSQRPTLSGPALSRTHARYLRSFENEIPQQLRESVPSNK